jgi:hypothetical protein
MPLDHDVFAAINDEIMRIQAKEYRHRRHHFKLDDEGMSNVSFRDVGRGDGFHGRAPQKSCSPGCGSLPSGGGSEEIRREFS